MNKLKGLNMNKLIAISCLVAATSAGAQTTLPLSNSTTFGLKADKASPSFTGTVTSAGPVVAQGQVNFGNANTPNFYATANANGPYVNFANGTLLGWYPATSDYRFYTSGTTGKPPFSLAPSIATFNIPKVNVAGPDGAGTGSAAVEVNATDQTHTGFVSFTLPNGTRAGYVGFGSSQGIALSADGNGAISLQPAGGTVGMSIGKDSNGKLQINVNGLPTSCSNPTQPTGTLWVTAGNIKSCP